ncbi:thiamine-phosphate kinase [Paramagnetospirillum marisnigri]|uniref:Thiamine-monophosphate kinase n=1 Tax=Paramagnetospirillum marisnigri TaxID=1285242 RepID=A0A178MPX1_9PROT|nr:thiamine-phosphate kinase [Paramagnetospirillum marisnigri]OAN50850.1 thiamine-phosphate kinase [Paramagnetospirillum marisnigri]
MSTTGAQAPDEFGLIAELFAPLSAGCPGALNLTDDAAFLAAEPGFDTVATMDAMVAGVHFLPDDPPELIARKLVRVNLSDLAAKGAVPRHLMLAAAFPKGTGMDWLRAFAEGLRQDVEEFGVSLIGGDTVATPGPLTLSLTALGRVEAGRGLRRSGAVPGDHVYVSGSIGDGALGLLAVQGRLAGLPPDAVATLAGRYRLPQPRIVLGPALVGLARASMDVSDGLVQDLGHICRVSGVSAVIEAERVPLSDAARAAVAMDQSLLALVLTGGDDYELLFTVPAGAARGIESLARRTGVALTRIGRIEAATQAAGVSVVDADGVVVPLPRGGWRHF